MVLMMAMFYQVLRKLIGLISGSELYSHIMIIPIVSGFFIYLKRRIIFSDPQYAFRSGVTVMAIGLITYYVGITQGISLNQNDYLALMVFSAVILLIGGVMFFYGNRSFRAASFPLLFLFFLTPIPTKAAEQIVFFLQIGSAEATYIIFKLAGVPVLREGFTFHLSGTSIEVAKECSGIRSTIALFITGIVAGQLFLRSRWKKILLVLSVFPITIFKNGLRIAVLSLLGNYVDPGILDGELHKSGGIPFFVLALVFLAPVLFWLKRTEKKEMKAGIVE